MSPPLPTHITGTGGHAEAALDLREATYSTTARPFTAGGRRARALSLSQTLLPRENMDSDSLISLGVEQGPPLIDDAAYLCKKPPRAL